MLRGEEPVHRPRPHRRAIQPQGDHLRDPVGTPNDQSFDPALPTPPREEHAQAHDQANEVGAIASEESGRHRREGAAARQHCRHLRRPFRFGNRDTGWGCEVGTAPAQAQIRLVPIQPSTASGAPGQQADAVLRTYDGQGEIPRGT